MTCSASATAKWKSIVNLFPANNTSSLLMLVKTYDQATKMHEILDIWLYNASSQHAWAKTFRRTIASGMQPFQEVGEGRGTF